MDRVLIFSGQTVNATIRSDKPHSEKLTFLKEAGIRSLGSAYWMVYHPKYREFFFAQDVSQDSVDRENNLGCITQIAVHQEPIALYLVKNLGFRKACQENKNGLECTITIVSESEKAFLAFFQNAVSRKSFLECNVRPTWLKAKIYEIGLKLKVFDNSEETQNLIIDSGFEALIDAIMQRILDRQALQRENSESNTSTMRFSP